MLKKVPCWLHPFAEIVFFAIKKAVYEYQRGATAVAQELPPLFAADENEHFGVAAVDAPFAVQVRFSLSATMYVAERRWSARQTISKQKDGSIILDFTTRSGMEVVKWVLGFGRDAELIAPQHLRERIREEGAEMLARYA